MSAALGYAVVIPSANAKNLLACVRALVVGGVDPGSLILVDDGARAEAQPGVGPVTWITGIKPFVYARNVNLGITAAAGRDIVIVGDDVELITPGGFDLLAETARSRSSAGVVSAAVRGVVGNGNQSDDPSRGAAPRSEADSLAFVCVYVPRAALDEIGALDERFDGYGCEDVDFCWRALEAGRELLVDPRCVVGHGRLPSSFRTKPNIGDLDRRGRDKLREKWGRG